MTHCHGRIRYPGLCARAFPGGPCVVSSLLAVWNFSAAMLASANLTADLAPTNTLFDQVPHRPQTATATATATAICHCHCHCCVPPTHPPITHTHQWPCCAPLRYKLIAASLAQVLRRPIVRSVVVGGTGSGGAATALQMAFLLERGVDSASEELVSEWESRVLRRLEGAAAAPAITTPGVVMCCTCRNFLNTHL